MHRTQASPTHRAIALIQSAPAQTHTSTRTASSQLHTIVHCRIRTGELATNTVCLSSQMLVVIWTLHTQDAHTKSCTVFPFIVPACFISSIVYFCCALVRFFRLDKIHLARFAKSTTVVLIWPTNLREPSDHQFEYLIRERLSDPRAA